MVLELAVNGVTAAIETTPVSKMRRMATRQQAIPVTRTKFHHPLVAGEFVDRTDWLHVMAKHAVDHLRWSPLRRGYLTAGVSARLELSFCPNVHLPTSLIEALLEQRRSDLSADKHESSASMVDEASCATMLLRICCCLAWGESEHFQLRRLCISGQRIDDSLVAVSSGANVRILDK